MEAIVLVGGLGTRLGSLTKHTPKPMLPIRGVPFIECLLVQLKRKGIIRVVLATGYKSHAIQSHFANVSSNLPEIIYSIEDSPLGTGGATRNALRNINSDMVFVLNGDSYLDINYKRMLNFHSIIQADITIASHFFCSSERYGFMNVTDDSEVLSFCEKGIKAEGWINGGVYLISASTIGAVFASISELRFSFEKDILSNNSLRLKKYHFPVEGYFIDIGVPEDLERAQSELFF